MFQGLYTCDVIAMKDVILVQTRDMKKVVGIIFLKWKMLILFQLIK